MITFEDSGKTLRLSDSIENCGLIQWLSASGTIPKSKFTAEKCYENLKNSYKSILIDFPTLRLKLVKKDNLFYWSYATDEEIKFENLVKIINSSLIDEVPEPFSLDIAPLWRVQFSQIDEKTKIKVIASHSLVDGRNIFELLDLFASYSFNMELPDKLKIKKNQPVLYEFGKNDWFSKEITEKKGYEPFGEIKIDHLELFPDLELPSHLINIQRDVPYPPISKFCRKHGITPQAFLMAVQNEAIREFHKGEYDNIPIGIHIAVDNKASQYATELFKKSLFFVQVGFVVPFMENEKDMLKNMKNCAESLKKSLIGSLSCDILYFCSNFLNYETKKFNPPKKKFDGESVTFASHIGLVGVGLNDLQFRFYQPVMDKKYKPSLYGYHNKEIFSFVLKTPFNIPEDYFKIIKDVSLKYYEFMKNDISE